MLSGDARPHAIQFLISLGRFREEKAVRCAFLSRFGDSVSIGSLIHDLTITIKK
jgi:hypothetical protein